MAQQNFQQQTDRRMANRMAGKKRSIFQLKTVGLARVFLRRTLISFFIWSTEPWTMPRIEPFFCG